MRRTFRDNTLIDGIRLLFFLVVRRVICFIYILFDISINTLYFPYGESLFLFVFVVCIIVIIEYRT